MNSDNENLVKNIRNNNKEALDILILKFEKMIRYFEKSYKMDRADILGVIYQILINKNLNIEDLNNYIFLSIKNEAHSIYKKKLKELETIKEIIKINDFTNKNDIEFEQIIDDLSKQNQKYLTLKYKYGYSIREIAKIEATPKSTIHYQITKAINNLKNILLE